MSEDFRPDPYQKKVIDARNHGALSVVAFPGSGKTATAVEIVLRWLEDGVPAKRTVMITFTRSAAEEMRVRIRAKLPDGAKMPMVTTFHRFGYCLILRNPERYFPRLSSGVSIWGETERVAWMKKKAAVVLGCDDKTASAFVEAVDRAFSRGLYVADPEFRQALIESGHDWAAAIDFLDAFMCYKETHNLIDFHDMVIRPRIAMERDHEYRETVRRRFSRFVVDEFQDIDPGQLRLLTCVASPERVTKGEAKVIVVGDPKQSIYTWRNACEDAFERFRTLYSDTLSLSLPLNYRSRPAIVRMANRIFPGAAPAMSVRDDERRMRIYNSRDDRAMMRLAAKQIAHLVERGVEPGEILVMARINRLLPLIQNELIALGIRSRVMRGTDFKERAEIRLTAAACRLIRNPFDADAFQYWVARVVPGVGEKSAELITENGAAAKDWLQAVIAILERRKNAIEQGALKTLEKLRRTPPEKIPELAAKQRGLGKTAAETLAAVAPEKRSAWLERMLSENIEAADRTLEAVKSFAEGLETWRQMPPDEFLRAWRDHPLFRGWLLSHADKSARSSGDERRAKTIVREAQDRINYLIESASSARNDSDWRLSWTSATGMDETEAAWQGILEFLTLDPPERHSEHEVRIGNIHTAKGSEAEHCFLVGANDGVIPAPKSDPEEEKRLFYVACTRGKEGVYLHAAKRYRLPGLPKTARLSPYVRLLLKQPGQDETLDSSPS